MEGYEIDFNEISFGQKIGQGSFGAVYLGEWRHTAWSDIVIIVTIHYAIVVVTVLPGALFYF